MHRFNINDKSLLLPGVDYGLPDSDIIVISDDDFKNLLSKGPLDTVDVINGAIVITKPADPLLVDRISAIGRITQAYNEEVEKPIIYNGATFQADSASVSIIAQRLAPGFLPNESFQRDINNINIPFSIDDLRGLQMAINARRDVLFDKWQTLKAAIRDAACNSIDQINAVNW